MKNVLSAMGGLKKHTVRIQLSDTSQNLTDLVDAALGESVDWSSILAVLVTCETYDSRIAFGADASATVGHVLAAGGSVRLPSQELVGAARIINKTAGSNAIIQVTLE